MLNGKDDEIGRLTEQVMNLEDRLENQSPISSKRKNSPIGRSPQANKNLVKGYGAVTNLENKLIELTKENKEL